jgi:hypothetical protein
MKGQDVFKFAVKAASKDLTRALATHPAHHVPFFWTNATETVVLKGES